MANTDKMICPNCKVAMNHHCDKLMYTSDLQDPVRDRSDTSVDSSRNSIPVPTVVPALHVMLRLLLSGSFSAVEHPGALFRANEMRCKTLSQHQPSAQQAGFDRRNTQTQGSRHFFCRKLVYVAQQHHDPVFLRQA